MGVFRSLKNPSPRVLCVTSVKSGLVKLLKNKSRKKSSDWRKTTVHAFFDVQNKFVSPNTNYTSGEKTSSFLVYRKSMCIVTTTGTKQIKAGVCWKYWCFIIRMCNCQFHAVQLVLSVQCKIYFKKILKKLFICLFIPIGMTTSKKWC